ncbi:MULTISPECIES: NAD-dependent epimerase/dehydratase family protein [Arthrobacter]|uniref:Nucleoside-diphosphate-sugar epimerase n=1 Tax=Arthrobacter bambusae TaxID=1338426 RepID=A0AAW8D462_9MICC|nr:MULTISPECIES: NAD-dependent epimerase/dehydratase family protein [Arthrobacter]MDP9903656.1 nucleoside-diphosphate-sugar epimerase [Arthrobacter bambusae]MDQ0128349.1 nucleoside-diphosphate-sugar epimerase [Arthrobacter bambusae]MDQ0179691.1 nucleoside-diphosphate-sugar epimerase [Arthrobacter bambusae]
MRVMVTGCAGFIGSHLVNRLLADGHQVTGIDSFTDYYPRELKERNNAWNMGKESFQFIEMDLAILTKAELTGVDAIIHLAAQPGVRASWAKFDNYINENLLSTHKLATAAGEAGVKRFVFASSSSVYGDAHAYPTHETTPTIPRSPYGVTKLAGESLLDAHAANFGLEVFALRFFTVYGPGQRPDMAIQRLIRSAIDGGEFRLYGDGHQRRDFTFVADIVDACVRATSSIYPDGTVRLNIGGSGDISMNELISLVESTVGGPVNLSRHPAQLGDVLRTGADGSRSSEILGWKPRVQIEEGVARQVKFELEPTYGTWGSTH